MRRKQFKTEFASLNIEVEDVDFIIAAVLAVKRTDLTLIDEVGEEQVDEIKRRIRWI